MTYFGEEPDASTPLPGYQLARLVGQSSVSQVRLALEAAATPRYMPGEWDSRVMMRSMMESARETTALGDEELALRTPA